MKLKSYDKKIHLYQISFLLPFKNEHVNVSGSTSQKKTIFTGSVWDWKDLKILQAKYKRKNLREQRVRYLCTYIFMENQQVHNPKCFLNANLLIVCFPDHNLYKAISNKN